MPDISPDNINDLGSGETGNFKVVYVGMDAEDVASYDIAVGSGFNGGDDLAPSYYSTVTQTASGTRHHHQFQHKCCGLDNPGATTRNLPAHPSR